MYKKKKKKKKKKKNKKKKKSLESPICRMCREKGEINKLHSRSKLAQRKYERRHYNVAR